VGMTLPASMDAGLACIYRRKGLWGMVEVHQRGEHGGTRDVGDESLTDDWLRPATIESVNQIIDIVLSQSAGNHPVGGDASHHSWGPDDFSIDSDSQRFSDVRFGQFLKHRGPSRI